MGLTVKAKWEESGSLVYKNFKWSWKLTLDLRLKFCCCKCNVNNRWHLGCHHCCIQSPPYSPRTCSLPKRKGADKAITPQCPLHLSNKQLKLTLISTKLLVSKLPVDKFFFLKPLGAFSRFSSIVEFINVAFLSGTEYCSRESIHPCRCLFSFWCD